MRRWWAAAVLAATALLFAGCAPFVDSDQVTVEPGIHIELEAGTTVGQTFVARHGGLSGIAVWIQSREAPDLEILLHLREDPDAGEDLAVAYLDLADASPDSYRLFELPSAIRESHGRYYYAYLEVVGIGSAVVGAASGGAYLDGALHRDHEPLDGQMSFRLTYDKQLLLAEVARAAVSGMGLLVVAGLLYVLPGWALLAWLAPGWPSGWPARLGIAVGLSLAFYPLLFLWTDLAGLHLGALYAYLPPAAGLLALFWRYWVHRPEGVRRRLADWARSRARWPDIAFLGLAAVVLASRLIAVRSLEAPMWGDSYQHTVMAQLLVDNGGLFRSWEPYAPLESFTYHFGFHSQAAVFHWVTGLDMPSAVLWFGQLLNGLAVLALYPLASKVSGTRWGGVGAVLVAGLLSPMPMYYVNWGRYTQLAGQAVLPAAVLLSWVVWEQRARQWRLAVLAWIAVGGLALTHYRVLIFYAVFAVTWLLLSVRRTGWRRPFARVAAVGAGAAALFLPWFVRVASGAIMQNFGSQLTTAPSQLSGFAWEYNAIGDLASYLDPTVWLLLVTAGGIALWRHQRAGLLVCLWWFLLLVSANPHWLGLPGIGAITNLALFIGAYVPAGVLVGGLGGQLVAWEGQRRWAGALVALAAVALGLAGASARVREVRPDRHALVTRPDLRAMEWVRENTPQDSRFLVNSFFAYGGSHVVGSDGGWWLPLLAARENTVPPLNYGTEEGPWAGFRPWVNDLTSHLATEGVNEPSTLALLAERGITHVYVGQRQGRVNYDGAQTLNPEELLSSPCYQLVYHMDRVWVFEVLR
jgi:hypothetical protein